MTTELDTRALLDSIHRTWQDDVLPAIEAYTRLECLSPAFDPDWEAHGALLEAAGQLAAWAADRGIPGLTTEVLAPRGRTPLLLVEVPASDGTAPDATGGLLIYGHLDKQPPQGAWLPGLGPYLPVRRDERLYGRGTADDGYALFAAVTALEALTSSGVATPRCVILIEASEESASPDLDQYLDDLAERIGRPDLVVCLDSGCLTYDRLWLTASLRGCLVATVRAQVLTEGVHSGMAGGVVPSSFRVLRQVLDRLEDPSTGTLRPAFLTAEVPAAHRAALRAVAEELPEAVTGNLPTVDGLELAGADGPERLVAKAWAPALAVTGAEGLPPLQEAGNVLRPYTSLKLSIRLPPTLDAAAAGADLASLLAADPPEGAEVTVEVEEPAQGWVAPEPEPWVTAALATASEASFGRPPSSYGEGGTIPFLATLSARFPGIQLVATGVLGPHSNAHGPNEFLHIPMAEAVTSAVAHLLAAAADR